VQDVLDRIEEAENVARDAAREVSGTLRVAAVASFAAYALAPHLPRFFERCPKVRLELTSVAGILDGADEAYDVSLIILPELPAQATFVARRLASTELIACASPAYLAGQAPPLHPDDLQHHRCLLPAFDNPLSRAFVPRGGGEAVLGPVASHLVTTNVEALREAAEAGLGITALPSFLAAPSLASGRLQWVLSSWRLPTVGIWAGLPSRRYLPARTRAFVDWLVQVYGGEDADPWLKDRPAAS
jgi:DNA-binding transcriptional LysR family regulator